MNHAEHRLVTVCDDLLASICKARALGFLDKPEASPLINRILDIRNLLSPPQPKAKTQAKP